MQKYDLIKPGLDLPTCHFHVKPILCAQKEVDEQIEKLEEVCIRESMESSYSYL